MIEFCKAYRTSTGETLASLQAAQETELFSLLKLTDEEDHDVPKKIVENKQAVIDILTTTDSSRPRARRIHGGKKTRNQKPTEPKANEQS